MPIGYDKHRLDHQLLLDLTMEEVSGATGEYIHDRATPHHECMLQGATIGWTQLPSGLWVMDFTSGTPDWIDCAALDTGDLDFTTEVFSMGIWAYISAPLADRTLLCRGLANTDGWYLLVSNTGRVGFATCQAGLTQSTFSTACIDPVTWYFIGITRDDADVIVNVNGVNLTDAPDTHTDPTTANRELHIGILDDETSDPWESYLWRPRIWGSRVLEQWEWEQLFNYERHWFGV